MQLGDLTWFGVKEYLKTEKSIILPLGSCEQHGRHLPLSTDMVIAARLAEEVSRETGVLLAPEMGYGVNLPCDRFMYGTAGLSFDSLRALVADLMEDWRRQGFRRFYLLTAHGGAMGSFGFAHQEALKEASRHFLVVEGIEVYVIFPYWIDISDLLDKEKQVEHAGEVETSLIMYLRPDLVISSEIRDSPEPQETVGFEAFPEGIQRDFPHHDFYGGEGYPSVATAEKGERIFSRLVETIVTFVKDKESS